ncbi:hypothetical protein SUGI_0320070 [Cryptomeria japonica]|nr:hypothetical protein SUGI_0320070 [Cryptomeria japonica]
MCSESSSISYNARKATIININRLSMNEERLKEAIENLEKAKGITIARPSNADSERVMGLTSVLSQPG